MITSPQRYFRNDAFLDDDKAYLASVEYVQRRLCAYLDAR
jgi:hypothetical protein